MCQQRINPDDLITADDSGIVEQELLFQEPASQPTLAEEWLNLLRDLHPATWVCLFLLLCLFVSLVDQFVNGLHIH